MIPTSTSEVAVEFSNVSKTFDGKHFVLADVSFRVYRGEITVIIGPSGTGKSVLLKIILGLLKPTNGSVRVLGQEITTMDESELSRIRLHYGMLFQDAALFDDLSALENVMFPLRQLSRDLSETEMFEKAKIRLKQVGIEELHFSKLPSQLSGGMRKRVGLARALALDPEILMYDEPTTGLDPILTETIDDLIVRTELAKRGVASIVVSHELFGALKMADQIIMLDGGKVVLCGKPQVFMNSKIPIVRDFVSTGLHLGFKFEPLNGAGGENVGSAV